MVIKMAKMIHTNQCVCAYSGTLKPQRSGPIMYVALGPLMMGSEGIIRSISAVSTFSLCVWPFHPRTGTFLWTWNMWRSLVCIQCQQWHSILMVWPVTVMTCDCDDPYRTTIHRIVLPIGKWLACQSMNNQIMIFGVHNNFRLNRKKSFRGHLVAGYSCVPDFSPDGRYFNEPYHEFLL